MTRIAATRARLRRTHYLICAVLRHTFRLLSGRASLHIADPDQKTRVLLNFRGRE